MLFTSAYCHPDLPHLIDPHTSFVSATCTLIYHFLLLHLRWILVTHQPLVNLDLLIPLKSLFDLSSFFLSHLKFELHHFHIYCIVWTGHCCPFRLLPLHTFSSTLFFLPVYLCILYTFPCLSDVSPTAMVFFSETVLIQIFTSNVLLAPLSFFICWPTHNLHFNIYTIFSPSGVFSVLPPILFILIFCSTWQLVVLLCLNYLFPRLSWLQPDTFNPIPSDTDGLPGPQQVPWGPAM